MLAEATTKNKLIRETQAAIDFEIYYMSHNFYRVWLNNKLIRELIKCNVPASYIQMTI